MTFHLPVDRRKGDVPLQRRKGVYAPRGQELSLQEKRMSILVSSTGMESNLAPRGHPQQGRTAQHFFWLAPKPFCSQRACSKALGHIGRKPAGRSPKIESMPSPLPLGGFFLLNPPCPSEMRTLDPQKLCRSKGPFPSTLQWSHPHQSHPFSSIR